MARSPILLIDDSSDNLKLLQSNLDWCGYESIMCCTSAKDGLAALDTFSPHLIILDLLMPEMNGYEFLEHARKKVENGIFLPILVFTGDLTPDAKIRALQLGASDFLTKPVDAVEILLRVRNFLQTRQFHTDLNLQNEILEIKVKQRTELLEMERKETVEVLSKACEYRDDVTGQHSLRVGALSAEIAVELGLDDEFVESLRLVAPLHDIGKLAIPDTILHKEGRLTDDEYEFMKRHVPIGADMFAYKFSPLLQLAGEIALHHHERWDGSGYGHGLVGDQIPLSARIVAVADSYDALTNDRPYRKARPQSEALAELIDHSGRDFDPQVVAALCRLVQGAELTHAA